MEVVCIKTRLKTSFRPKPRDQILFSKVNYRQKVRFKTANFGLYEIEKEIASFLGKFKPDEMCCNEHLKMIASQFKHDAITNPKLL